LRLSAQHAGHIDTRTPVADIPLPSNLGKYRVMVVLNDNAENLEHCPYWLILPSQDIKQRLALLVGSTALQNWLHMPIAVMDSPGEIERGYNNQTIQTNAVALPFGNLKTNGSRTLPPGWGGIGFTRATEIATTILDVLRFK
jgi:hypothetical protein